MIPSTASFSFTLIATPSVCHVCIHPHTAVGCTLVSVIQSVNFPVVHTYIRTSDSRLDSVLLLSGTLSCTLKRSLLYSQPLSSMPSSLAQLVLVWCVCVYAWGRVCPWSRVSSVSKLLGVITKPSQVCIPVMFYGC